MFHIRAMKRRGFVEGGGGADGICGRRGHAVYCGGGGGCVRRGPQRLVQHQETQGCVVLISLLTVSRCCMKDRGVQGGRGKEEHAKENRYFPF